MLARIRPVRLAGEIAAGQDPHIILAMQVAGERGIVDGRAQPEIETAFGPLRLQ
ncbi:hypothetical protein D3C83_97050 [compost metagenome]